MRIAILAAFPLHLIPGLGAPPPRGHYATWLPQLSVAFAEEAGLEIHWLISTRSGAAPAPVRWRNQVFHVLPTHRRWRVLRGYRWERAALRQRLQEIAPDLVHAWGTEDCYGLAGAECGRPWLLSMQGILGEYLRRTRMHPWAWLQAWHERTVLRQAQEISVESHWGAEVLHRRAPQARVHLVEYGVQEVFYEGAWEPDPARPVALFIGTPDRRKGVEEAIAAFARPELQGAELHILGDREGPLAQKWQALATPNVRWLGRCTPAETAAALRRAWCLVLPTRADTSPNAVKEARVVGLPVVTTPHGGQSDYIQDGENGFLLEPEDVPGLADRLARILGSVETARRLGAPRWPEQREFFRPQATAAKFLSIYRQLTG